MEIEYRLDPKMNLAAAAKKVQAMQRGLYILDALDQKHRLPIDKVQVKALKETSLPNTFESIRLALTFAFTEQLSKIGELTSGENAPRLESIPLSETTNSIAEIIDIIVSTAVPHLVLERLEHSYSLMEQFWPSFSGEPNTAAAEKFNTLKSRGEEKLPPGAFTKDALPGQIPKQCPPELGIILFKMLANLERWGLKINRTRPVDWIEKGHPTLKEACPNLVSFAASLRHFSKQHQRRFSDPKERIEHTIQESREVLACMKFCYLIILTQLDVPPSWYCTQSEWRDGMSLSASGIAASGTAVSTWASLAPAGVEGFAALTAAYGMAVVATGGAALVVFGIVFASVLHFTAREGDLLQLQFDKALSDSAQVLGISSSLGGIGEMPIARHLENEMRTTPDLKVFEKWQGRLKEGLKAHLDIKLGWEIKPTIYWAKWLFSVARIGKLRQFLSQKTRIGVLGPTEGGKSERC